MQGSRALYSAALALLLALSLPAIASASILQPNSGANPDDVFALLDSGASAGSSSDEQAHAPRRPSQFPSDSSEEVALLARIVEAPGPSGSSTSPSSTSTSLSSGGAMAFMVAEALSLDDSGPASRLATSRCFLPAIPVGAGLFRPPRS